MSGQAPRAITLEHMKRISIAAISLLAVAHVQAEDVELDRWLRHMRVGLPVALCAEGTAIRTCFAVAARQCEQGVAAAARSCIADMRAELPSRVQLPEQGKKLGADLGECTANAYVAAFQSKYVASDACMAARSEVVRAEGERK